MLPTSDFVRGLVLSAAVLLAGPAGAQPSEPPVPQPDTVALLQQAYGQQFVPRSAAFAQQATRLASAVDALCDGPAAQGATGLAAAQAQWRSTTAAWDRLAGVAVGPLVKRRALTALDFNPTRPATIERAIQSAPSGPEAMERIGTPAKGIPALEWLLWSGKPAPQSPACRYTQQVARELAREAGVIAEGFATQARTDWAQEKRATFLGMQELVNQWLGGVERLRWTQIDKPLKAAESSSQKKAPAFTRAASGHTGATWAANWEAQRSLGDPVAAALQARGKGELATRLQGALAQADKAMGAARPDQPATLAPAVEALGAVKKLIEAEIAPVLDVTIGFSDGDGD
ncbi:imelysin family protein [Xenophilus arseniciresistens]|uniref:Imelysin family protein n=1 Tax=Xenophilus arseniciresistens TaxID=1283306 RepID=A0AAE3N803_9BURK|nr:imelysin family protein [Xenophilus arseniciresistens]MDA7416558.1 imelysin family protein [Xenophilus arseniciresistens]